MTVSGFSLPFYSNFLVVAICRNPDAIRRYERVGTRNANA